jgi:hypothetical protein
MYLPIENTSHYLKKLAGSQRNIAASTHTKLSIF